MSREESTTPLLAKAQTIAREVQAKGGRALLVGGYVRDELLGLHPKDADLEVYGIEAGDLRRMLQRFGRVDCVGESFRVYKLVWFARTGAGKQRFELDLTLPRRDRKVGEGHRGFEVEGDPHATIEDAARRRDFTINAILKDPLSGDIIDPFGGRRDLEARLLRVVDPNHFGEDSLRVLRAVQFAARFELTIEPETIDLCRSIPLDDLPAERIWGEWEKLLLKAPRPSLGIRAAHQLDVLERLFPDVELAFMRRGKELLRTVDAASQEKSELPFEKQVTLMMAAIASYLGWRGARKFLNRLNVFTLRRYDVRRNVIVLAGERKRVREWYQRSEQIQDREFRWLSTRCEPRMVYHLARARGDAEAAEWFIAKMRSLGVEEGPPEPFLMGRHLLDMGLEPGPCIGKIVQETYARQLTGEITTLNEALAAGRELVNQYAIAETDGTIVAS